MNTLVAYSREDSGSAWWYVTNGTAEDVTKSIQANNAQLYNLAAFIDNGSLLFMALMEPASTGWWWYYGVTAERVSQLLAQNGAMLTDVCPYWDTDRTLKFACIMTPQDRPSWWYVGVTADQVTQYIQQNNARLTIIRTYRDVDSSLKFVVNMVPADRAWWWYYDVEPGTAPWGHEDEYVNNLLGRNSARLTDWCAYQDGAPAAKLAVIMEAGAFVDPDIGIGERSDRFQTIAESGPRLAHLSTYSDFF